MPLIESLPANRTIRVINAIRGFMPRGAIPIKVTRKRAELVRD